MLSSGCRGRQPAAEIESTAVDSPFLVDEAPQPPPSTYAAAPEQLVVEFNVHRYSAPQSVFTDPDAAVWKLFTTPLPAADMSRRLADNGIRAAVGRESDREPLARALEELRESTSLRSAVDHVIPDVSRDVELLLGPTAPRLSVFLFDGQGRLAGQDFEDAQAKFLLNFEMRFANIHEVWLQVVPAIEEPPGPLRWVVTETGDFRQTPEHRRHVFSDVNLRCPVPEGGFVILGPTEKVYDLPYLARPLFLEQAASQAGSGPEWRESIYVISPILRSIRQGALGPVDGSMRMTARGSR
jgi:hypothetical protein